MFLLFYEDFHFLESLCLIHVAGNVFEPHAVPKRPKFLCLCFCHQDFWSGAQLIL